MEDGEINSETAENESPVGQWDGDFLQALNSGSRAIRFESYRHRGIKVSINFLTKNDISSYC